MYRIQGSAGSRYERLKGVLQKVDLYKKEMVFSGNRIAMEQHFRVTKVPCLKRRKQRTGKISVYGRYRGLRHPAGHMEYHLSGMSLFFADRFLCAPGKTDIGR